MATEATAPQASRNFVRETSAVSAATMVAARRLWQQRMPRGGRWQPAFQSDVAPELTALMIAAQTRVAASAAAYVPAVLEETGQASAPAGVLVAEAMAGTAATGWPLDSTLYGAVVAAGQAYSAGLPAPEALEEGAEKLASIILTELADTARLATVTQMAADEKVTGWVRMIVGPTCARCLILAGRFYRWSDGFERHPNCDCRHIPATEDVAGDLRTDPEAYWDSLTREQQDGLLGEDRAEAVRMGADLAQVVNAQRGMYTTVLNGQKLLATREGTVGAGRRRPRKGGPLRLMPETIIQISANREEAIRLLRLHGYIR